jgi:hypothetical protein
MAHDPGPCGPQFEDWEDAYDDWQDADKAADEAIEDVAVGTGLGIAGCILLPIAGCIIGAGNALKKDYDSIEASLARNEAAAARDAAKKAYEKCVNDHKKYYNPGG